MTTSLEQAIWSITIALLDQPDFAGKNLVLSPHSVRTALSVLSVAADNGSSTQEQIHAFLGGEDEGEIVSRLVAEAGEGRRADSPLRSAIGLFVGSRTSLDPIFADTATDQFAALIEQLPYSPEEAAAHINAWVSKATEGRIPNIVSSVDSAVALLVVSALYFRSEWAHKFNPTATFDRPFTLRSGAVVQRPAMHKTETFPLWTGPAWQLVELPYRASDFAMVVALPSDPASATLDIESVRAGIRAAQPALVQLQLPRFDVSADLSLLAALRKAGVRDAFDLREASFRRLGPRRGAATDVLHKARVTVTEEGTEAAAATAIPLVQSLDRRTKVPFVVDRPFWFFLRDRRSGDLLFVGRVEDPKGS
ncbi:MAG: serpin family protein [Polyangiaceae bacterium]